jgi:hypothetical protein
LLLQAPRGNVDLLWDVNECAARITHVQGRRAHTVKLHEEDISAAAEAAGTPVPPQLGGAAAAGAAATPGRAAAGPEESLPAEVVHKLVFPRLLAKYQRMGIPDKTPGLQMHQLMQLVQRAGGEGQPGALQQQR